MEKTEFVIREVLPGKLNALVKNLMREMKINDPNEAVRRVNSGEWVVSPLTRPWREQDGVIYFSVTSDGITGEEWITRLEKQNFQVGKYAKQVLRSSGFKPTKGITTKIAVLKGELFTDNDRTTKNIRTEANKRNLTKPNAEVACLIREKFSDKDLEAMGFWWIIAMHEPIKDSDGDPRLLSAGRCDGGRWLGACYGSPGRRWNRYGGFAFAVSSSSA